MNTTTTFNHTHARQLLERASLAELFTEELGWERYAEKLPVRVNDHSYSLQGIAQKRGLAVFTCAATHGHPIPGRQLRNAIEAQVAQRVHEHLIIFINADRTAQVWHWVRKLPGHPVAHREHRYRSGQPGDSLLQKLEQIAFSLDDEANIESVDVTSRVRAAFDIERITKRFYDRFQGEHNALLVFLSGIPDAGLQRWYASVLLNRLMFLYFIQKKGLLAGDVNYLQHQLTRSAAQGNDRYYLDLLCPLFFNGLARRPNERTPAIHALLGDVPYLNGGLFQRHQIEQRYGEEIRLPDAAFERLFAFFEQYHWHLDERPLRADNEINPDVLGYIFEKYINQKQMGAYYTKEDITEYIGCSTIIPYLLDQVVQQHPESWNAVLATLQADPDRYTHPAARYGTTRELPELIAAGIEDVRQRDAWNEETPEDCGLPGEIWRETVARRERYTNLTRSIIDGNCTTTADLVTANLDLRQLAHDLIEQHATAPALLTIWQTITQMSVIDPTCGSGAFLFAALNILEPLYDACLERMEHYLEDAEGDSTDACSTYAEFRSTLARVGSHPNRRYFILKSIIVNNLFGVDIMEEAVEICRLRLFLKLVAQIDEPDQIEPLPDIDFNIRAGNTLVGFATYADVERAVTSADTGQLKMIFDDTMEQIEARATEVDALFTNFRQNQTIESDTIDGQAKQLLQDRLNALKDELNQYLAREYGVDPKKDVAYQRWRETHQPFHWFVEFYGILKQGGFDVIIGNPPYVAYSKVRRDYTVRGYTTEPCGNLYALTIERALALVRSGGWCGMIVPIASVSTEGMAELQQRYGHLAQWHSHYAVRPGKLFVGVDMNLTISLFCNVTDERHCYGTGYRRWSSGAKSDRPFIFTTLSYVRNPHLNDHANLYPKLGSPIEAHILRRMLAHGRKLGQYVRPDGIAIYYHSGGRYWRKALLEKLSSHYKPINVNAKLAPIAFGLLNSQLFYWYWISNSNCMDVVSREVLKLPVFPLETVDPAPFAELQERLLQAYATSTTTRVRRGERIRVKEVNFDVQRAKPVIDDIDRHLAQHYGLSASELDFILNYDIKYRTGRDSQSG
jgi:hypothetical protein